ncbi:permease [Treponema pedis]|uniref:permease n=1 Tax=Treponema pedis TaxID=409322 RepID=UPI0003FF4EBE|nr:permease [Treponema pedis]
MQNFISVINTVFLSILLQAFPFMLLGAIISSILHIFVSDKFVIKIFPSKNGLGFLTALFGGLCFPVCECASVPVISGLIKKGVAMPIAITFMLAAPILNPISIMSTLYAFPDKPMVMIYRIFFGIVTALAIGLFLLFYPKSKYLKEDGKIEPSCSCGCAHTHSDKETETHHVHCSCDSGNHNCDDKSREDIRFGENLKELFLHTGEEFFNAGKYLIFGALVTAIIRVCVPADFFIKFTAGNSYTGIALMMLFAFLFSACSTSDAFIARSFYGNFSLFSVMGFLVYGPMMDIKNIFMLLSFFKKQFVIELAIIITVLNFIFVTALGFIFL